MIWYINILLFMNDQQITKREMRQQRRAEKLKEQARALKQKRRRSYITWGVAFVIIMGIIVLAVKSGGNNSVPPITNPVFVQEDDHKLGDGRVALIEYSDFECPACGQYQPIIKQLQEMFPDDLQIVYRHYPLTQIHKYADQAARVAEAAGMQGKFWEMHDKLFENQENWSSLSDPTMEFEQYAEEIGLNIEQFKSDINSDFAKGHVSRDRTSGNKLGLRGTPTFFLQGRQIQSPPTFEAFRALIQSVIDSTPELLKAEEETLPTSDELDIPATEDAINTGQSIEESGDEQSADTESSIIEL